MAYSEHIVHVAAFGGLHNSAENVTNSQQSTGQNCTGNVMCNISLAQVFILASVLFP